MKNKPSKHHWVRRNGSTIPMSDMDHKHLANSIAMLIRSATAVARRVGLDVEVVIEECYPQLEHLQSELKSRIKALEIESMTWRCMKCDEVADHLSCGIHVKESKSQFGDLELN